MQLGCRIQPQGHRKNRIKSRLKVRKQFVSIEIYATSVYAGRTKEVKRWYKPRQYNRLFFFRLNSKRFCFQPAKIAMHFLSSSSHWLFLSFDSISRIAYFQWISLPQNIFAKLFHYIYYKPTILWYYINRFNISNILIYFATRN